MTERKIDFRVATSSDGPLLFDWVNRPDSLVGKLQTTEPVPLAVHDAWFSARLADPDTLILIAETDGEAVGQVRLQRDGDEYTVDIYVTPENRGQQLSDRLIEAAIERLASDNSDTDVVALVKSDNPASAALFRRTGFSEIGRSQEIISFKRSVRT